MIASSSPLVGVLALQGAAAEHRHALARLGVASIEVRTPADLRDADAVVLPGGESTTVSMLLDSAGLRRPLAERLAAGMPAFGTCAGMILLAADIADGRPDQHAFGAIDISVRRNAFGSQAASFETELEVAGLDADGAADRFPAVFIRAPWVERVGADVEVLARVTPAGAERAVPVLCRARSVLVSSFHPELSGDDRVHRLFVDLLAASDAARR